jgi:hypothetical protein
MDLYKHHCDLAASCETKAHDLWRNRKKVRFDSREYTKLLRLRDVYRDMANARRPASAFADDCVFEVGGTLAVSCALQQPHPTPVSEEQEPMPLIGGRGEKPPRPTWPPVVA